MSVQYAVIVSKQAYLNTDFGVSLAHKWFGFDVAKVESIVGRYSKGSRKGQLRGMITWRKTEVGGWYRLGKFDGGRVSLPGEIQDKAICDAWSGEVLYKHVDPPTPEELAAAEAAIQARKDALNKAEKELAEVEKIMSSAEFTLIDPQHKPTFDLIRKSLQKRVEEAKQSL